MVVDLLPGFLCGYADAEVTQFWPELLIAVSDSCS